MAEETPPLPEVGYCTNVHAGATLDEALDNLDQHSTAVRDLVCPGGVLPIGLWLSARAARQTLDDGRVTEVRDRLDTAGLRVFTINGFPHGDFHGEVVKHRVYEPDWRTPERLVYTMDLAEILTRLLPEGAEAGISTLPIAWGASIIGESDEREAAARLMEAAEGLDDLHERTGRSVHLDIEPEPGCFLQRSEDIARFFEERLLGATDEHRVRRRLRVCHDVCHAAVMFEEQSDAFDRYAQVGLRVGKVQVSSCVLTDFGGNDDPSSLREALTEFVEQRYLHQTVVRGAGSDARFFEDLPDALSAIGNEGEWRTHFHVPVHLERIGPLRTTRHEIESAMHALRRADDDPAFEVETYAWPVLPTPLRPASLAAGIAEELRWTRSTLGRIMRA